MRAAVRERYCRHSGSAQALQARTSLPPAHRGHHSTAIPLGPFLQFPEFSNGPPSYSFSIPLPTPVGIHSTLAQSMQSEDYRNTAVHMMLVDNKNVAEAAGSTRMSQRSLTLAPTILQRHERCVAL